ncbi:MAG: hypothetical protein H6695_07850 [Deferribacteres bacterium]|nr:hypothetical protein [candidate division KSB1 bacterium]MCB9510079.1 hypothetical protein [Deferribacteres bacterium]
MGKEEKLKSQFADLFSKQIYSSFRPGTVDVLASFFFWAWKYPAFEAEPRPPLPLRKEISETIPPDRYCFRKIAIRISFIINIDLLIRKIENIFFIANLSPVKAVDKTFMRVFWNHKAANSFVKQSVLRFCRARHLFECVFSQAAKHQIPKDRSFIKHKVLHFVQEHILNLFSSTHAISYYPNCFPQKPTALPATASGTSR